MRQAFVFFLLVFGIPAATLGQTPSADSQTLQALLSEVRELRQDLRISLARVQSAQILLAQLQIQQAAVTRALERLNDARAKLTEAQAQQNHVAVNIKRLEDMLSAEENLVQQKELRDRISHSKSELEDSAGVEQQRQATEIDAEQQLRTERDKLNMLETQLDELVRKLGNASEQSAR
jgi:DNA repair exonuclease SbcCD ATPase subunit